MRKFALCTLTLALLAGSARAGDGKEIFKVEDKLTATDPPDTSFKLSKQKAHTVKLEADKYYRIDVTSKDFDTYLRLLDDKGNVLVEDDDNGDDNELNSRIIIKLARPETCKFVVTSFDKKVGSYKLTVVEISREEGVIGQARNLLGTHDKGVRTSYLADLSRYLQDKGKAVGVKELKPAFQTCLGLERVDPDQAAKAYEDFSVLLAKSTDKEVVRTAERMMGCSRRFKLPGREMDIKGTLMDGKAIDWKSYRGKVVLVDFWATWCGPCRAEIPNMKKNLELYKDRGFEIVTVSIDQDREDLEAFLDKEKLPWVCIHEKIARDGQPLANHYGVMFIPLAILIDRDGKVVSLSARGTELDALLKKLIGPEKKKAK